MAKEFVKFDENVNFDRGLLVENVEKVYERHLLNTQTTIEEAVLGCESPIEQILAMELNMVGLYRFDIFNPNIECIGILTNEPISCGDKNYRVDFLLGFIFKLGNSELGYNLVVECDGFQYHQGNKTQIDIDYERQANLQANGYDVLRFSGSKIIKKPHICVFDIIRYVAKKYETIAKKNRS